MRRLFNGEDWTAYNRISIWIYPDLPGFYTTALDCQLSNDGNVKLPAIFGQEGQTSLVLKNHQWNHVVWEIGNVARDKITSFEMSYGLSGNYPEEAAQIRFYFDQMELEKVDPDKIEGWDVWAGRISYPHTGYQTGAQKTAVANGIDAKEFKLVSAQGKMVLTKPIEKVTSQIGSFQVMDFTEVRTPGTYTLKAGNVVQSHLGLATTFMKNNMEGAQFFLCRTLWYRNPGSTRKQTSGLDLHAREQADGDQWRLARCR